MPPAARPYQVTDDVLIIGTGAAGLATAIAAARHAPELRIRCLDGAKHLGAKILVSGGGRCNVTNRVVTPRDFWGGSSRVVGRVLRAFPVERTIPFFEGIGVPLHEEVDGKLFPNSNRARTVLDALLAECARRGVRIDCGSRVVSIARDAEFVAATADERRYRARAVVIATGGQALPKSGSDGNGYVLAQRLGHRIVPTTPALAPLLLDGDLHPPLRGVAHPASLTVRIPDLRPLVLTGDWLWTHFGASGPLALNASRHWLRADLTGARPEAYLAMFAGEAFETADAWLMEQTRRRPRAHVPTVLGERIPAAVATRWVELASLAPDTSLAHLSRDARRRLAHALTAMPLSITGSRGYQYAEATAGGVALDEVDPGTLESRRCGGVYLAGEVLDVDGRLGGFNFQWAWSSGFVAGTAVATRLTTDLRDVGA